MSNHNTIHQLGHRIPPRPLNKWLNELYSKHEIQQLKTDPTLWPEVLCGYLSEVHEVTIRDDGVIEFYRLDKSIRNLIGTLPVVLYHHTASGALPGIQKHGLIPSIRSGKYVFLTTETSGPAVDTYHRRALSLFGGDPVTLEVITTLGKLRPDPDDRDIQSGKLQFVTDFVPVSAIVGLDTQNPTTARLYHTTSFHAANEIQQTGELRPKDYDGFISFSEYPITHGDISSNDVILVFDAAPLLPLLDRVRYTEDWYLKHTEQASYIAGEGWREQLDLTDCYDPEDDWEDDDCANEMTQKAELESFLYKSEEKEWVSKQAGEPIRFSPAWLIDLRSTSNHR